MGLYYILRDKIPFFLTMIYLFRDDISKKLRSNVWYDVLGYYLVSITFILFGISVYLLFTKNSLLPLVGFKWNFPSPIEWGLLILMGTRKLHQEKGLSVFESYYLSFLLALSGGWLYEVLLTVPIWIQSGFPHWNVFGFNLSRMLFFEFRIFALPIVVYLLKSKYSYRFSNRVKILCLLTLGFYFIGHDIRPFFNNIGKFGRTGLFSWMMRVPAIIVLYSMLNEVKKIE